MNRVYDPGTDTDPMTYRFGCGCNQPSTLTNGSKASTSTLLGMIAIGRRSVVAPVRGLEDRTAAHVLSEEENPIAGGVTGYRAPSFRLHTPQIAGPGRGAPVPAATF